VGEGTRPMPLLATCLYQEIIAVNLIQ